MSIFDFGEGPKRRIEGKSYEFGIRCDECGSFETESFPTAETSVFDVVCEECGATRRVRVPGV